MKNRKILSFFSLILLIFLMCSGCGFGVYNLEFILPDGSVYKTHTYGPGDSLTTTISAPSVIGYDFIGWSPNTNTDYVITLPYSIQTNKLYAKYEIDEGMFYSYSTINYYGTMVSLNIDATLQNTYYILINNNSFNNFELIEIMQNNSGCIVQSLVLRDSNAKIIKNNTTANNLSVKEQTKNSKLVLEIQMIVNGDFTIVIQ